MSPSTFNAIGNGNDIDSGMCFYTLADAVDMVEFQESLVVEEDPFQYPEE